MADLNVNSIGDASGGTTTSVNGFTPTVSNMAGRNRIINGDMRIDQRNAGASVAMTGGAYITDRWRAYASAASKLTAQQSSTAPAGFINSLLFTSQSAYTQSAGDEFLVEHRIEGLNVSDLGWGTINAKTITVSFYAQSSVTGTFSGCIANSAGDRNYPFTFAIASANTMTYCTVTIPGDTTGTWLTTNGVGVRIKFNLGTGSTYLADANAWTSSFANGVTGSVALVNTSGATFYITGVQLEVGEVATPFERRSYGQELALCQRYYQQYTTPTTIGQNGGNISAGYSTYFGLNIPLKVTMRTNPAILQNLNVVTDSTGTIVYYANEDAYGINHGNMSGLYSYISGTFKVQAEL